MEPTDMDVFIDHKETVINAPRPRQMSASKVDIIPVAENENTQGVEGSVRRADSDSQTSVSPNGNVEASVVRVSSSVNKESERAVTVKKHATTIYTRKIIGRASSSSETNNTKVSPPAAKASDNNNSNTPIFGSRKPVEPLSPTEVCTVQFNVAAGVSSCTTTAFSKMFTKTLDTNTEVDTKERHLSECSLSIGAISKPLSDKSVTQGEKSAATVEDVDTANTLLQSTTNKSHVFSSEIENVVKVEEKEASEYCPGLAIRTLTLEDLQEKKISPDHGPGSADGCSHKMTEMAAGSLSACPPSTYMYEQNGISSLSDRPHSNLRMSVATDVEHHVTSDTFSSLSASSMTTSGPSDSVDAGKQVLKKTTEDRESAAPLRKPFFNPIEVERKFTIADDTEERLRSLGARLHKEKTFTDVYFDNGDYSLITTDCWLRRRNSNWEAKVPLKSQSSNALFAPASQYTEITNEREISRWLVDRLGLEHWMRGDPIDLLIQAAGLTEFAKFTTTRRSYTLPSCVVDLDLTDHNFCVGEIEVMAASPEEIPQALHTIGGVAQQLGVQECDEPPGKMSFYLRRFNPQLYCRLVKLARLR